MSAEQEGTYCADPAPLGLPASLKALDYIPEEPEGDRRLLGRDVCH